MEEKYIAAVDMGSGKIALSVAKISGDDVSIVFYGERPSNGIKNSAVFNPMKAAAPIREIISEAENELKIKILQVIVGLPRCDVFQETAKARADRTDPDENITLEEVENLKAIAQEDYPLSDPGRQVLYGAVAQSFSTDEEIQLVENDIVGVISSSFEGNFKLFIGRKSAVRSIDKIFNDLGIAIARKYFTPAAQAKAVLTEDEMNGGVALVDFGAGATSVTIYQGNILRHYAAIPFGGNAITGDITNECGISPRLAENIKYAFGACMPEKLQTLGEKTIQIEGGEEEGFKQIPVKYLSEIITARVREILDAILYEIQGSGLADNLRNGMVITGGGAKLTNLANYIKEVSGYSVRVGRPRRKVSAEGCKGVFEPSATTLIGMILSAKEDGLAGCVDPAETPVYEELEGLDVVRSPYAGSEISPAEIADSAESESPAASARPAETAVSAGTAQQMIPEDATEGTGANLFPDTEVPKKEPEKGKKENKGHKVGLKMPRFLRVTWDRAMKYVDSATDEMS